MLKRVIKQYLDLTLCPHLRQYLEETFYVFFSFFFFVCVYVKVL